MVIRSRRGRAGFTTIELLIAISITAMLMLLINQLFMSTSRAVSLGIETGEAVVASEALGEQIEKDMQRMLGPNRNEESEAGFLVITNRMIPTPPTVLQDVVYWGSDFDPTNPTARIANLIGEDGEDWYLWNTRLDQLSFIVRDRTGSDIRGMTPMSDASYSNDVRAPYARVWYGHVLRTLSDGTLGADESEWPNHYFGVEGGMNELANNWILGRQQLLLYDVEYDEYYDTRAIDLLQDGIMAASAYFDEEIYGYSDKLLYNGLTDVADMKLHDPDNPYDGRDPGDQDDPADLFPTLLGELRGENADPDNRYREGDGASGYAWTAAAFTYPPSFVPPYFGENASAPGPLVNPHPKGDTFSDPGLAISTLAQMHMHLAGNVSDFAIDFAGSYETSYLGDDDTNEDYRYSGLIDRDPEGNIKWYSYFYNNPDEGHYENGPGFYDPRQPVAYDATAVLDGEGGEMGQGDDVFILPEDSDPNDLPNEAYVFPDPTTNPPPPGVMFVFRHDDDGVNSKWPYLIRIRYRMHDPKGRIRHTAESREPGNTDFQNRELPGRWFEHIIAVPRP